jgi:hypothetical protein
LEVGKRCGLHGSGLSWIPTPVRMFLENLCADPCREFGRNVGLPSPFFVKLKLPPGHLVGRLFDDTGATTSSGFSAHAWVGRKRHHRLGMCGGVEVVAPRSTLSRSKRTSTDCDRVFSSFVFLHNRTQTSLPGCTRRRSGGHRRAGTGTLRIVPARRVLCSGWRPSSSRSRSRLITRRSRPGIIQGVWPQHQRPDAPPTVVDPVVG